MSVAEIFPNYFAIFDMADDRISFRENQAAAAMSPPIERNLYFESRKR
jgi:hypothetical protein